MVLLLIHETLIHVMRQVHSWQKLGRSTFREAFLNISAFADLTSLFDAMVIDLDTYEASIATLINKYLKTVIYHWSKSSDRSASR